MIMEEFIYVGERLSQVNLCKPSARAHLALCQHVAERLLNNEPNPEYNNTLGKLHKLHAKWWQKQEVDNINKAHQP